MKNRQNLQLIFGNFNAYLGWFIFLIGISILYSTDSHATNHLAGIKSDISDTFGANSDVPYFLLLAEGVVGAMGYIKTKNLMILAGVPVLMVFTHFALS